MKLICYFLIFTIFKISGGKEIESNDISASTPSIHLDTTLRKALLRALTELENEDQEKRRLEEETGYSTTSNPDEDRIVEKASASAVSFYANEEIQQTTTEKEETTERPVVIIQRSSGVSHKPIISVLNSDEANEEFIASASSGFGTSNLKNIAANVNNVGDLGDKSITAGVKSEVVKPTTPLPKVVTEENQAKAEDVQFFSAPLVAAFTVHQDERGLPKKVEPIYKSEAKINKPTIQEEILRLEQEKKKHEDLLRQKLVLEQQLAQQKFLLNNQQFQQQKLLYQEQQKKLLEEQQKKLVEEQQKRLLNQFKTNEQPFIPINPNNRFKENTLVSFQPSISITSADLVAGSLPLNAQILPIKNYVNFHQSPTTSLNNHYTPLQPPSNFQNFPNNFIQNLPDTRQSTRVFRQEFGTGNFGFNQNQNRFFRSNDQPQNFNQQLNNLLLNSGFARNVRQNEDLNLVSKVLSYNVGRDQFYRPIRF